MTSPQLPSEVSEVLVSSPSLPSSIERSRSLVEHWQRRFRYLYLRFMRLRAQPEELARGLAAGVFAGLFPLFGLQTIIGIAIALRIGGNPLMAAAGTWVSNPLTYVPIYAFNYNVGRWLMGVSDADAFSNTVESYKNWLAMGTDVAAALFLGCFVVGAICSILSYTIGLPVITQIQERYHNRQKK